MSDFVLTVVPKPDETKTITLVFRFRPASRGGERRITFAGSVATNLWRACRRDRNSGDSSSGARNAGVTIAPTAPHPALELLIATTADIGCCDSMPLATVISPMGPIWVGSGSPSE